MSNPFSGKNLFIDFDSTFVKVETIDELASVSLEADPDKDTKINLIKSITNQAMSGEIDFPTALEKRLHILSLDLNQINLITDKISTLISDSFKKNKELIKQHAENIWIISGGFTQIIIPIVKEYGIKSNHVIANTFTIDGDRVTGCEKSNPLFKDKGKIHAIKSIKVEGKTIMIGDGYTDLEVYLENASDYFIYYSENVKRDKVISQSELIANSFDEVLQIISKI